MGVYYTGGYEFYETLEGFTPLSRYYFPNMPHNEGANYLFFDGHVEWYPGFTPENVEMTEMCDSFEQWKGDIYN